MIRNRTHDPFMAPANPIPLGPPPPNTVTLGLGLKHMYLGGHSSVHSSPGGSSEGLRFHSVLGNDSLDVENEAFPI